MIVEAVYILCGLASLACAILLGRGYLQSKARLLLWSCLCFVALTINNALLFLDVVVFPDSVVLTPWRTISTLSGVLLLIYGLIWDTD